MKHILEHMARSQKVAIVMMQGGERHHLKILGVEDNVLIGESRCLYHNYEIGRKIHQHALDEEQRHHVTLPGGGTGMTMADAIDRFGTESHRFRFYLDIGRIHAVAEDQDDIIDETPFFPGLL